MIAAFIGSGVASAIVAALFHRSAEKKRVQTAYISEQLRELYGPLSFLCSANQQIFDLASRINSVFKAEYVDKKWSSDPHTQEAVKDGRRQTIALENVYVSQVVANNEKAVALVETHWHLVEPEDIDLLTQYLLDFRRYQTESGASPTPAPFAVDMALGEISFMRPNLVKAILTQYDSKQSRLRDLRWGNGLSP